MFRWTLALTTVATFLAMPVAARADLLVHYTFAETGSTVVNHGTLGGSATMYDASGAAVDLHGVGVGPSTIGGNVFNNSAATMGYAGGVVSASYDVGTLTAFTFSGWFKTAGSIALGTPTYNAQTLFSHRIPGTPGSSNRFELAGAINAGAGTLTLQIRDNAGTGASTGAQSVTHAHVAADDYNDTGSWFFLAVTYADSVIKFYSGTETTAVQAAGTYAVNPVTLDYDAQPLTLGNNQTRDRAFDGYIADMRLYNQALNLAALEDLRNPVIPEPAGALMLLTLGALALRRR